MLALDDRRWLRYEEETMNPFIHSIPAHSLIEANVSHHCHQQQVFNYIPRDVGKQSVTTRMRYHVLQPQLPPLPARADVRS